MRINRKLEKFLSSALCPPPSVLRRGQTAIEYLLVTVSMLFVFVLMYSVLQPALANYFKWGGMVIVTPYK